MKTIYNIIFTVEKGKAYLHTSYENNYDKRKPSYNPLYYKGYKMKHNIICTKGKTYLNELNWIELKELSQHKIATWMSPRGNPYKTYGRMLSEQPSSVIMARQTGQYWSGDGWSSKIKQFPSKLVSSVSLFSLQWPYLWCHCRH